MRHLRLPILLTRAGMVAERAVRAFWPLWTVLFIAIAPLMFGWQDIAPVEVVWGFVILALVGLVVTIVLGTRAFHWPTHPEAVARVDAALPGRPIAAVADTQVIGSGDAASEAVWQAHLARMAERTKQARAVDPDLRIAGRDPYAVRYVALLFFVVALLFGSLLKVGSVATLGNGTQTLATGPVWEGWIAPPAYTGKPTLYLADLPQGPLNLTQGSTVTLRLYGEVGALTVAETVSGRTGDLGSASDAAQEFTVTKSGEIAISGENGASWTVTVLPDAPPAVELTGPVEADAMGEMRQPFQAMDDYGVDAGTATITVDLPKVDRAWGLATDPDPRDPLVLDLPVPFNGDRADFEEFLTDNLSEDPFANLPVTIQLAVTDGAGQTGETPVEPMILPGRRFFQPVAKAVIEQRRDLLWSKANARRVLQIMRAVTNRPDELFTSEAIYLRARFIIRRLDGYIAAGLTDEEQTEIAAAMWELAVQLEDGSLADARARLERAQERLAEAMKNGASQEEIADLMQELREAIDDYTRMLAQNAQPPEDQTDQPNSAQNDSMEITRDQIQAMMDRIQQLMEEGKMAEAAELMQQLNDLMENLQVTQGQQGDGQQGPGQQSMQDLADTLQNQEGLSDEAFRDLQEQFNPGQQGQQGQNQPGQQQPGQQGQQGQEPQNGQDGQQGQGQSPGSDSRQGQQSDSGQGGEGDQGSQQSLAERQQALRNELERQREGLPALNGEAGDAARQALERAEGAMDGAEQALRDGDLAEAIDRQAEAMNALREGLRNLGEALAQNRTDEPGQGTQEGSATSRVQPAQRDPLGRQMGNTGQFGSDENMLQGQDVYRRAQELLGEIRRRSAEQDRPEVERNYLKRLLDRF